VVTLMVLDLVPERRGMGLVVPGLASAAWRTGWWPA